MMIGLYMHDSDPDDRRQSEIDCQFIPIAREDFDRMSCFGKKQIADGSDYLAGIIKQGLMALLKNHGYYRISNLGKILICRRGLS